MHGGVRPIAEFSSCWRAQSNRRVIELVLLKPRLARVLAGLVHGGTTASHDAATSRAIGIFMHAPLELSAGAAIHRLILNDIHIDTELTDVNYSPSPSTIAGSCPSSPRAPPVSRA